jgi:hypothetical protein
VANNECTVSVRDTHSGHVVFAQNGGLPLEATLYSGGNPMDLSTADEVRFVVGRFGLEILNVVCSIVDAAEGKVTYEWGPGELDSPVLFAEAEFQITFMGGQRIVAPDTLAKLPFSIIPSVANDV